MLSLIFLILSIVVIISWIDMLCYFRKKNKHDKVLFELCQLRRDIIGYLRNESDIVLPADLQKIMASLNIINNMIHSFDDLKPSVFNYFKFKKLAITCGDEFDQTQLELFNPSKTNKQVGLFQDELKNNITNAFFEYTPFITIRIKFRSLIESYINTFRKTTDLSLKTNQNNKTDGEFKLEKIDKWFEPENELELVA